MWTQPLQVVLAGAGTNANALAGTPIEYIGEPVQIDMYGNTTVAGTTFGLNGFTGAAPGQSYVPTGSPLGINSTVDSVKTNEDFIGTFSIPGNTRLTMPVTATAASHANFRFVVH